MTQRLSDEEIEKLRTQAAADDERVMMTRELFEWLVDDLLDARRALKERDADTRRLLREKDGLILDKDAEIERLRAEVERLKRMLAMMEVNNRSSC